MLTGTPTAANANVKKDERLQISNLTFYLNKLEEEQTKPTAVGGGSKKEHQHTKRRNNRGKQEIKH